MRKNTKAFIDFIVARHQVFLNRKAGMQKPWTPDAVLQAYRFCNVYRELDTVTLWVKDNWREPNRDKPDVWFAMVVARLVNWPQSLLEFSPHGPVSSWRPKWFVDALDKRKAACEKVFTGAYMIHAGPNPGSKAGYLAEEVLTPMWERRAEIRPRKGDTLESFHARLMTCKDMGSFMAGQVVADTKYTDSLGMAPDWWTWAAMGPGSQRGLSRVAMLDIKTKWKQEVWLPVLQELQAEVNFVILKKGWTKLHAQDIQNCLCEFDKYERVRLGEGRPRSLYNGRK